MDCLKYNLFNFAPRELSHSAFWAWVLQCADQGRPDALVEVSSVAARLLSKLGIQELSGGVRVTTEKSLPRGGGRVDIYVEDESGTVLVIENKVKSVPDREQLDRYGEKLKETGKTVHRAILSTAFDEYERTSLPWRYIGLDDVVDILGGESYTHPALSDYIEWARSLKERRRKLNEAALSDDVEKRIDALRTSEGQWGLMKFLTENMMGYACPGKNLSGTPWTQFRFCEGDDEHDALFYRIDVSAMGPYFSLRQYQKKPSPTAEKKRNRLTMLRETWSMAWRAIEKGSEPRAPRDGGEKESEIGWCLLKEISPGVLKANLQRAHDVFVERLRQAGWPILGDL